MANSQGMPVAPGQLVDPKTGLISVTWWNFFLTLWRRTGGSSGTASLASGLMMAFAGSVVPSGWLLCDGTAVSREAYAALFESIGVTWGPGDGSTTFNLPDLRGRVGLGVDGSHALGSTGGASTVTISIAQLPSHNHTVTDPGHTHGVTDPGHIHTALVASSTNTAGAGAGTSTAGNTGSATTGLTVNSAVTGVTTNNTGSGNPVDILPPYAAINWIIAT